MKSGERMTKALRTHKMRGRGRETTSLVEEKRREEEEGSVAGCWERSHTAIKLFPASIVNGLNGARIKPKIPEHTTTKGSSHGEFVIVNVVVTF